MLLMACADPPPPAAPARPPEAAAPSGPVIGPAMTPAEKPPVVAAEQPKGELLPPATFPAAKPSDLDLTKYLPASIEGAARVKFAEAEEAFLRGDPADKLYAAVPKGGALAPWLVLARIRARAKREEWPTSVGGGDEDKRVASALAALAAIDLGSVTPRAPFQLEQGRWLLVHGDYERARTLLDEAVSGLPDEAEPLSLQGLSRLASGQVQAALDPIERATALDLGSAARWGNLGTIRMMNGKINEATRAYAARVHLTPNDAQAHTDYAIALLQIGELTKGRAEAAKATELEPNRASYWSNLGYALHRGNLRAEAKAAYERALAKDPKLLVGLLGYSALLSENPAQLPEARQVFERAQKIAPDDPRVVAAKADLEQLEKKKH